MYDPKAPLSMFFVAKLDLKDKIINKNQEDREGLKKIMVQREKEVLDLKENIKEKDVKK